jgi:hypothetical protein
VAAVGKAMLDFVVALDREGHQRRQQHRRQRQDIQATAGIGAQADQANRASRPQRNVAL